MTAKYLVGPRVQNQGWPFEELQKHRAVLVLSLAQLADRSVPEGERWEAGAGIKEVLSNSDGGRGLGGLFPLK